MRKKQMSKSKLKQKKTSKKNVIWKDLKETFEHEKE